MANTYVAGVDGYNAATPTYNTLVNKVYDWANRDIQALPPQVVRDSIRYAVDTAYRTLRIPPLENTVTYTNLPLDNNEQGPLDRSTIGAANIYQSTTALAVPPDLIEFIHIRGRDDQGLTTRVFNEKSDVRSYWDLNIRHYEQTAFWTRQGNSVLLTPSFGRVARGFYGGVGGPETQIEMHYYRRLPALDAQYDETFVNWMNRLGTFSSGATYDTNMTTAQNQAVYDMNAGMDPSTWTGNEVPNWFKNENEKIALMGALGEVFAYLQEDDQAGKYIQLFNKEIQDLNDEDRQRDSSGGNVQVQYTANGLI